MGSIETLNTYKVVKRSSNVWKYYRGEVAKCEIAKYNFS